MYTIPDLPLQCRILSLMPMPLDQKRKWSREMLFLLKLQSNYKNQRLYVYVRMVDFNVFSLLFLFMRGILGSSVLRGVTLCMYLISYLFYL